MNKILVLNTCPPAVFSRLDSLEIPYKEVSRGELTGNFISSINHNTIIINYPYWAPVEKSGDKYRFLFPLDNGDLIEMRSHPRSFAHIRGTYFSYEDLRPSTEDRFLEFLEENRGTVTFDQMLAQCENEFSTLQACLETAKKSGFQIVHRFPENDHGRWVWNPDKNNLQETGGYILEDYDEFLVIKE